MNDCNGLYTHVFAYVRTMEVMQIFDETTELGESKIISAHISIGNESRYKPRYTGHLDSAD